ncbi:hypothetical protein GCM10025331_84220 [Actinoplanes utahensis]|nr:hypothetical protein Aut01nite_00020 [Actinoplanes utahensis]
MPDPRRPRKPPGAGPEQAKRDHYLRLMAQGMNNSAACREVGINRRTGTRWRYGRNITGSDGESRVYPPIAAPKRAVSARYLSEGERITISAAAAANSGHRGSPTAPRAFTTGPPPPTTAPYPVTGKRSLGRRPDHGCPQPDRHRHPGRAHHPLRPPRPPTTGPQRRTSPPPAHHHVLDPSGRTATVPGLGPGRRNGRHAEFTAATSTPVYFCDPAGPWQRGANENTNGLLRQYFPERSDLSLHTAEDLTAVPTELNNRPRKILGWDTPAQRFTRLLAEAA